MLSVLPDACCLSVYPVLIQSGKWNHFRHIIEWKRHIMVADITAPTIILFIFDLKNITRPPLVPIKTRPSAGSGAIVAITFLGSLSLCIFISFFSATQFLLCLCCSLAWSLPPLSYCFSAPHNWHYFHSLLLCICTFLPFCCRWLVSPPTKSLHYRIWKTIGLWKNRITIVQPSQPPGTYFTSSCVYYEF